MQAPADPNAKREAKGRLAGKRPPRMTGVLVTMIVAVVVTVGWSGLNFTGESAVVTVGATMRAHTSHGWESISVPPATTTSGLQSVACPSTRFCVAVGSSSTRRLAHTNALLEVWNGSRWSRRATPSPSGRQFDSVSCTSPRSCVAVGNDFATATASVPFSEIWNGTHWGIAGAVKRAEPNKHFGSTLQGVSCAAPTFCIAVGDTIAPTGVLTLAEAWNGATWALMTTPNSPPVQLTTPLGPSNTLTDVACPSAAACMAVGYDSNGDASKGDPIAMSWNGSAWSLVTAPPSATKSTFTSVSCTVPTACEAVGSTVEAHWNGATWSSQPNVTLATVSCSSGAYQGVGTSPIAGHKKRWRIFAERLDGKSWVKEEIAPRGKEDPTPHAVSCASRSRCMVVGNYTKKAPKSKRFYTLGPYAPLVEKYSG